MCFFVYNKHILNIFISYMFIYKKKTDIWYKIYLQTNNALIKYSITKKKKLKKNIVDVI